MKVVADFLQWLVVFTIVCGALSYGMLSRSSIRKLRTAVFYGIVTAVPASFAMISAVFPIWLAVVSLLASIAAIVWNMMWWHKATLADRRSLRLRSAVCATVLNSFLLWPVVKTFDVCRKGFRVVAVFQTQVVWIIAILAFCFVWSNYCRRKGQQGRMQVVNAIGCLLVALAIISLVVSAVKAAPSKSAKTKAAVETVGQGPIDTIKELFGKLLDSSDEEVAPDDESSVAAEAESDDESVAAEVAEESDEVEVEREPIVVENAWFDFYNLSIQEDGNEENDFDFGPKPAGETASEIAKEHRERLRIDPALGAGDIAWADALLGTRYLGEFYESCKHDWAKTINMAKERFMNDHEAYDEVLDAFLKMQAKAKPLVEDGEVMEDQMYMNPFTIDGYPDVIVLKTPNHKGKFLVYEYTIKGTGVVRVAYRIDCGFQPTDVQKVMNITPATETPEKKPDTPKPQTAGKITPAPTPTPKPTAAPTPTPIPGGGSDPKSAKDPSKAPKENTERNDDPGTGKATNSGSGSTKSAAASDSQKASDSGSVEDYDRKVEQNRSANAGGSSSGGSSGGSSGSGQKSGGESNKPSQSASGAKQDNNGDAGNGSGSIDKPTAKSEAAVSADTNQSVDASGSAGGMIAIPD